MPPKRNKKKARDALTSPKRTPLNKQVKKNTRSGKNLEISIKNSPNTKDTLCKGGNVQKRLNKKIHENVQLSKKDINIMLANEVIQTQCPVKRSYLEINEQNTSELPEKVKNKKISPLKQNVKNKVLVTPKRINRKPTARCKIPLQDQEITHTNLEVEVIQTQCPVKISYLELNEQNTSELPEKVKKKKISPLKQNVKNKVLVTPKRIKRKPTARCKIPLQDQETTHTNLEVEVDNSQLPKRKRKRRVKPQEAQDNKDIKIEAQPQSKPKVATKKKALPKIEKKIVLRSGKKNNRIGKYGNDLKKEVFKTDEPSEKKGVESPLPISKVNKNITVSSGRASVCSNFSWTRDISSRSSSFVTVSSNDFIRIDNKLPIVKLININQSSAKEKISKLTIDNNKSLANVTSTQISSQVGEDNIETETNLGLSSSSSSSSRSNSESEATCIISEIKNDDYLSKLSTKLQIIDLEEVIIYNGCTNSSSNSVETLDNFKENIFKYNVLREEKKLFHQFQPINRLLSKHKKNNSSNIISENTDETNVTEVVQVNKPNSYVVQTKDKNRVLSVINSAEKTLKSSEHLPTENTICYEGNDDEDTLSLYAESITGLDSSKRNNYMQRLSESHNTEEYVPEFITNTLNKPATSYQPTKIVIIEEIRQGECQNNVANICEKQNADSTSVNKDQENEKNASENIIYEDRTGLIEEINFNANTSNIVMTPQQIIRFVTNNYKTVRGTRSILYKHVCFFNLIEKCKRQLKNYCPYPHTVPTVEEVESRLSMINEESFITEYLLTRSFISLRRSFGLSFVHQCSKRNLTRLLLEMAIDFITRADEKSKSDIALMTEAVEQTLLHLNNVDLSLCRDMLLFILVRPNQILFCDFLLKFTAESTNFTRFIPIFIKLAWFISGLGYRFDIQVSTMLLERVCILPYEDKLARALIEVIKKTSDHIFTSFMIDKFENILLNSNKALYECFTFLKKRKKLNKIILDSSNGSTGTRHLDKDIRYSPDTTNFDSMNKTIEPKLTMTIVNKVDNEMVNDPFNKNQFVEHWSQNVASDSRLPNEPSSQAVNKPCQIMAAGCNSDVTRGFNQGAFKRRLHPSNGGNIPVKIQRTIPSDHGKHKWCPAPMPSNSSLGSDDRAYGPRPRGLPYGVNKLRGQYKHWMGKNLQFGEVRRPKQRFY